MAYNYYFPQNNYPQFYGNQQMAQNQPQVAQNQPQGQSGNLIWVQGENAAKAYPVAAGQSVHLMDSENSVFYIKSTDQSGMPQPLRIFEYKEITTGHSEPAVMAKNGNLEDYVSRKEFDEFREDVKRSIRSMRRPVEEEGEG